ncbi:MAG TPA: hypothetical protein VK891_04865 [Euzebyales bacterium]|nr:hypothetical protein [Euzebyales bacterium]
MYDDKSRYYVVTAVTRSRSLQVTLTTATGSGIDLGAELEAIGSVGTDVTVERVSDTTVQFASAHAATFGVELFELVFNEHGRPKLHLPDKPAKVRRGDSTVAMLRPAVIEQPDDFAFLELDDSGAPGDAHRLT